jgi:hypothetical protein
MKIVDFKRDEENRIIVVLDDESEKVLSFEYVAQHKPQVGDELIEEPPAE